MQKTHMRYAKRRIRTQGTFLDMSLMWQSFPFSRHFSWASQSLLQAAGLRCPHNDHWEPMWHATTTLKALCGLPVQPHHINPACHRRMSKTAHASCRPFEAYSNFLQTLQNLFAEARVACQWSLCCILAGARQAPSASQVCLGAEIVFVC